MAAFEPESELERRLAEDSTLAEGLAWGEPRSGHPEGNVGAHVRTLLETIDGWGEQEPRRSELRFLAIVHDALKYRVRGWLPRTGENHHAMRARRLAERYTSDERLLAAVELHDRPYAIWRYTRRGTSRERRRLDELVRRLPDLPLFMRFVELDGSTEGKNPEPIDWLRGELRRRGALD
ncbi:MAG: HD domain-containing protein [Thermoleophilaceae bacterium]